jgi:hypothetical protein
MEFLIMENEIRVVVKNVYGTDKVYPYCMKARHFADIAGTKTMTRDTLRLVQLLGYQVRVQPTVINMENI